MILQISSGQGPAECELAVRMMVNSLLSEFPDTEILSTHESRFSSGLASALISSDIDLSWLEGSIQWICRSPLRPNHKRKNWFIDISVISDIENVSQDMDVRFERFHCGGKGGQNVNKVETGIRVIHIPTGIAVSSTSQRSQYQNKCEALKKLNAILIDRNNDSIARQTREAWSEHTKIVRGNPVRIYKGEGFELCKS